MVNFGFGVEHRFSDKFQGYGAFFSDRSAKPQGKDEAIPVALADWDIWHISAGGAFVLANIDITLGASYGWGSDTLLNPAPGEVQNTELDYRSIKVIFGFGISF